MIIRYESTKFHTAKKITLANVTRGAVDAKINPI